jgi:hypothetical protein
MEGFLIIIGFFILIIVLSWIHDKVKQFIDNRNYTNKLNKLSIQISQIDTEDLISKLDKFNKYNSLLMGNYFDKYFMDNSDQLNTMPLT